MATIKLFILCVIFALANAKTVDVDFLYKHDAVLDCSQLGDNVIFYAKINNTDDAVVLKADDRVHIEGAKLTLKNLRNPEIENTEYFCRKQENEKEELTFKKRILPFLFKPEKPSLTITQGGSAEFECKVLYSKGQENNIVWEWRKEDAQLNNSDSRIRINVDGDKRRTTLTIKEVTEEDKGLYHCLFKDPNGSHEEKIQLRVKNPLAALWPFLAIIGEVVVLCLVILIYEKKCTKKPNAEDDNEQNQNLLKDGQNSDLKKRTTKA